MRLWRLIPASIALDVGCLWEVAQIVNLSWASRKSRSIPAQSLTLIMETPKKSIGLVGCSCGGRITENGFCLEKPVWGFDFSSFISFGGYISAEHFI